MQVFVVLIGKAVHIGLRRHGHAELRIEDGNVGSTREKILADFDAHEVGRVVKRSERDAVANDLLDLIVDKLGLGHGLAAVQDAVADGVDFALVPDDALLGIREKLDDKLHGFLMRGEGLLLDDLFGMIAVGCDLMGQHAHGKANAFGDTGAEDLMAVHFEELIFAGRRSSINNENFHSGILCSCRGLWD